MIESWKTLMEDYLNFQLNLYPVIHLKKISMKVQIICKQEYRLGVTVFY